MYLRKKDVAKLRALRAVLTMQSASFDRLDNGIDRHGADLPKSEREVTDFIRSRTELWRKSWVFPTLDDLLSRADTPTGAAS